ncbi:hypothetical protein GDO78_015241 [Eleutherodactylus coqui]|uniref:Uncharacterized protein n=1 Tax=Eleutherodactylus coqui TaxID=57060 RepID=A0A8J6ELQ4_ELECQ|nr:hypothetical protein GDO78_015241 [Eleutherodactylus coqui]
MMILPDVLSAPPAVQEVIELDEGNAAEHRTAPHRHITLESFTFRLHCSFSVLINLPADYCQLHSGRRRTMLYCLSSGSLVCAAGNPQCLLPA